MHSAYIARVFTVLNVVEARFDSGRSFMDEKEVLPQPIRAGLWSRREVLRSGTAMGVVVTIPAVGTATLESALAAAAPKVSAALSADQSAVLRAIVGRLAPGD